MLDLKKLAYKKPMLLKWGRKGVQFNETIGFYMGGDGTVITVANKIDVFPDQLTKAHFYQGNTIPIEMIDFGESQILTDFEIISITSIAKTDIIEVMAYRPLYDNHALSHLSQPHANRYIIGRCVSSGNIYIRLTLNRYLRKGTLMETDTERIPTSYVNQIRRFIKRKALA